MLQGVRSRTLLLQKHPHVPSILSLSSLPIWKLQWMVYLLFGPVQSQIEPCSSRKGCWRKYIQGRDSMLFVEDQGEMSTECPDEVQLTFSVFVCVSSPFFGLCAAYTYHKKPRLLDMKKKGCAEYCARKTREDQSSDSRSMKDWRGNTFPVLLTLGAIATFFPLSSDFAIVMSTRPAIQVLNNMAHNIAVILLGIGDSFGFRNSMSITTLND